MAKKDITVPEIGEKITSGTVVGVMVKKGDKVRAEDPIIEFETDKAVVEIPAPEDGTISEVLVEEGQDVEVGAVIARLETEGGAEADDEAEEPSRKETEAKDDKAGEEQQEAGEEDEAEQDESSEKDVKKAEKDQPEEAEETEEPQDARDKEPSERMPKKEAVPGTQEGVSARKSLAPASPTVRRLARELGADINDIEGTGPEGRITPDDVKAHVKQVVSGKKRSSPKGAAHDLPDFSKWGETEREDMTNVRRITAEGMARAWSTVAHVTQFDKADITSIEAFRKKYNPLVEKEGGKLTVTAVLLKVIASALQKYPRFNATVDMENEQIIYKKYCHIGMAVDTDRGLLVPVIRDVDKKGLFELARELMTLSTKARDGKLLPADMQGGVFSISSLGGIGGTAFTPIVNAPEVAILGVSRTEMKPVWNGETFVPRLILPLSLSYDHRVVDGADGVRFTTLLVSLLGDIRRLLL